MEEKDGIGKMRFHSSGGRIPSQQDKIILTNRRLSYLRDVDLHLDRKNLTSQEREDIPIFRILDRIKHAPKLGKGNWYRIREPSPSFSYFPEDILYASLVSHSKLQILVT